MRSKVNKDIIMMIISLVVVASLMGAYNAYNTFKQVEKKVVAYTDILFSNYDNMIKQEVQTAISLINTQYQLAQKGEITEERAKQNAQDLLRELRYGENNVGYFWVDDWKGNNLVLLGNAKEGTNRITEADANGIKYVELFVSNAQKPTGGFIDYKFAKAKEIDPSQIPLPKRGYTAGFPAWQWAIGTGNYVDDLDKLVADYAADIHKEATSELVISILTFLVIIFVAVISALTLDRKINNKILPMAEMAKQVANGKLNVKRINVTSHDSIGELGTSLNIMVDKLSTLVHKMSESAHNISSTAEELSQSTEQSAQTSTQIVKSVTDVANGAERLDTLVESTNVSVKATAKTMATMLTNSQIMSEKASEVAEAAENGNVEIYRTIEQMSSIEQAVTKSAEVVKTLGDRSNEISKIVDTISGIASQTNLLALNAAIEAARAGEQGRGFAVVADEVRKLAEQVQEASKQIALLISQIQDDTQNAIITMDAGTQEVRTGTKVVNEAGVSFKKISELVDSVSAEIAKTVEQIKATVVSNKTFEAGIAEVDAITKDISCETQQISASTEEQSASIQEIASASESLARMSEDLNTIVSKFDV